ncbi:MAG: hypothetical protein II215_02720, partial [Paludibacteraceae bacterium]|nr:hypothetical protein [Paludibacteraceae bacterium]
MLSLIKHCKSTAFNRNKQVYGTINSYVCKNHIIPPYGIVVSKRFKEVWIGFDHIDTAYCAQ